MLLRIVAGFLQFVLVVRNGKHAVLVQDAPDPPKEALQFVGLFAVTGVSGWVDRYAGFCVPALLPARE